MNVCRRHPRVELLASVEVDRGGEVVILTVRNISLGGIFVLGDGQDLSRFAMGSDHELTIFTPADMEHDLRLHGTVVRHEADGMALEWHHDDAGSVRLSALIASGAPRG